MTRLPISREPVLDPPMTWTELFAVRIGITLLLLIPIALIWGVP